MTVEPGFSDTLALQFREWLRASLFKYALLPILICVVVVAGGRMSIERGAALALVAAGGIVGVLFLAMLASSWVFSRRRIVLSEADVTISGVARGWDWVLEARETPEAFHLYMPWWPRTALVVPKSPEVRGWLEKHGKVVS